MSDNYIPLGQEEKHRRAHADYNKFLKYNANTIQGTAWGEKRWVWVAHKPEGYIAGEVLKEEGKDYQLRLGTGEEQKLAIDKTVPMNPPKFDGVEDCAELSHLNEASVLYNLRKRYDNDLIYTYSGLFCVAVNPYKRIPIYTEEMINIYRGRRRNEVAPHIYAVADETYRAMIQDKLDQSMLITGESGAGKTENTKKVIQYIAATAGRSGGTEASELEQELLECNPLLEAFGNAKTNRNDNSSRFGKFIRLQFTSGGQVSGASIATYLLEKNRVVFQAKGERSFHIFYQLTNGASSDDKKKFLLDKPEKYRFLSNSGCTSVPGLSEEEEFRHTKQAMEIIGFSAQDMDSVFRTVSGVLWLGNIKFEANRDGAEIRDKTALNNVCKLLGVDPVALEAGLVKPRIKAGTEIVATQLSPEKADYSRVALAKAVYGKLFLRIVKNINHCLEKENQNRFIGVLDIAGFEIFEYNSFEQLCINYTNERLQQFFNNHMFKLEQEEYLREQINWTFIDFGMDSQDRIDLIDKKPIGVLSLLEEESFFPKATDETFLAKVTGAHSRNTYFKKPKFQKGTFRLAHYAGEVEYDVKGWLEKNRDPLQEDLEIAFKRSKDPFVVDLFSDEFKPQAEVAQSTSGVKKGGASGSPLSGDSLGHQRKGAQFVTVGTQYKEQLTDLMNTLYATTPHFVRCILPNHEKKPGDLQADVVLDQLRCNGVLEGIRISRKGFPNRIIYAEFLKRYYLLNATVSRNDTDPRRATERIMTSTKIDPEQYRYGLTKIFFRAGTLARIEELRETKIGELLITIQGAARGWLGRRLMQKVKLRTKAAKVIQKNVRAYLDLRDEWWFRVISRARPLIRRLNAEAKLAERQRQLAAIQKEIGDLQAARRRADEEYQKQKAALERAHTDLKEEKANKVQLQAAKEALEGRRAELEKKIEQLKRDIEADQTERKDLTVQKNRATQQADDLQNELNKETKTRQALENLKRENEAKIAELQGQVQAAEEKITRLEAAKRALERDVADLKEQLTGESGTVEALDKQRKQLQADIERLANDLRKLQVANDELAKAKKALEESLHNGKSELADTKSQREAHEAAAKVLQGELASLQDAVEKKMKDSGERGKAITKLESDLTEVKANLADEKEQKNNLDKTKRRLEAELKEASEKLASESAQRIQLEEAKRVNEAELAKLRVQLESANAKIASLEKTKSSLEATFADLTAKLERESADKDVLNKANKRLQEQLDEVNTKLADKSSHKAEVDRVRNQLTKLFNDLNNELNNVRTARDAADKLQRELETATIELRGEESDLSGKVGLLSMGNKKSESDLNELRAALQAAIEARDKAEKRRKQVEDEYDEAKRELEDTSDVRKEVEAARKAVEAELAEIKKKLDEEAAGRAKAESARKAVERELAELTALLEEKEGARLNLERQKQKLESEIQEAKVAEENEEAALNRAEAARKKLEEQVASAKEQLAALAGAGVDTETLRRKEAELAALREQLEKELEEKLVVEKAKRALEGEVRNLKQDLDEQVSGKTKLERSKREIEEEMEKLSDLFAGARSAGALEEIRRKNEQELASLGEKLKTETELRGKAEESRRTLTTQVSDLKTKVTELEADRSAAGRAAKKLETEVEDRANVLRNEQTEKLRVEKAVKKLEREIKALEGRLGPRKGVDEATILKLEDELADLKSKTVVQKKQREDLEGKNKTLSAQVANARAVADTSSLQHDRGVSRKAATEDQLRKLKEKLDHIEANKSEVEEDVRKQQESVLDLRKQYEAAKAARTKADADQKDAAAQLDRLKKDMDSEKSGKAVSDRERKKFEKELEDLRTKVDNEARARDRAEKTREKAEKEFKDAHRKQQAGELARTDIERQVDKLRDEAAASKKGVEEKRKENDRLESLRKDLDRQLKESRTQTEDERRNRNRSEQARKTAEAEAVQLKTRLTETEKAVQTLADQTAVQQSEFESLKTEVDAIGATRSKLEVLNKELDREIADLKDRVAVVDKERFAASEERKQVEDTLHEWKDRLQTQQRRAELLEKQVRDSEKELALAREKQFAPVSSTSEKLLRLEADNKLLQEKIDEEADKLIRTDGDKKELQSQLANLRSQSHKLEDELVLLKDQLAKEQRATAELQARLSGFFAALGKKQ